MKKYKQISDLSEAPKKIQKKVQQALTEDITERYDNSEYHNIQIIHDILQENGYEII